MLALLTQHPSLSFYPPLSFLSPVNCEPILTPVIRLGSEAIEFLPEPSNPSFPSFLFPSLFHCFTVAKSTHRTATTLQLSLPRFLFAILISIIASCVLCFFCTSILVAHTALWLPQDRQQFWLVGKVFPSLPQTLSGGRLALHRPQLVPGILG